MITVYWTAGTTGSMTLLWHCDVRCLHLNDRDVVRLMNYLLINEWVVTHTIRPVRERGEREVRLLWYPRYCLVQTLHNISLALVCWVIATSNHQTFEVTGTKYFAICYCGDHWDCVKNMSANSFIFQASMHTDSWFHALVFFSIGRLFER